MLRPPEAAGGEPSGYGRTVSGPARTLYNTATMRCQRTAVQAGVEGQLWMDMKEGATDVWNWYNGLPWYAQMGIDLGLALLEPSEAGEIAWGAKYAAKLGWNFLRGHADDALLAGARIASHSGTAMRTFGRELGEEMATHWGNFKNVTSSVGKRLAKNPRGGFIDFSFGYGRGGVYKGITSEGLKYIGQTKNYVAREISYKGRFEEYRHLVDESLETWQRRGIEQEMFERAALTGQYLQNKINPIDRTKYALYKKYQRFGKDFVDAHGLEW